VKEGQLERMEAWHLPSRGSGQGRAAERRWRKVTKLPSPNHGQPGSSDCKGSRLNDGHSFLPRSKTGRIRSNGGKSNVWSDLDLAPVFNAPGVTQDLTATDGANKALFNIPGRRTWTKRKWLPISRLRSKNWKRRSLRTLATSGHS